MGRRRSGPTELKATFARLASPRIGEEQRGMQGVGSNLYKRGERGYGQVEEDGERCGKNPPGVEKRGVE